ncbi:MAG: hypothetical protein Q7R90_05240 [bacterium]|nr:hypothetical protein [bacterium]
MKFVRILSAAVVLTLPVVASAEAARTFQELAVDIVDILDATTAVLIVAGIVVYFYGVSTNILNFSEDGMEKVKAYFFWGIIVLFVMVSIWGILRLLQDTLFGGSVNPTTGEVQTSSSDPFGVPRFTGE